ncbi:MAG: ABC transporter permease [Paludibacterium sp.]|uniref:methionine ABC transporter permease n=1 Tax=Paludibacterium sp. TaxID=1917523 RepID=UPI0025D53A65|nr:methionine ABC transporter permease [Paludibacterium sp.]MBV8047612.1 ABC transporter permease [Paludibacterium sp.]MBV8648229.1 ABC transporter permease [Paludibacterium sp.]
MNFSDVVWPEIGQGLIDTLVMSGVSLVFAVLLGLPLGVLLFLSGRRQLLQHHGVHAGLSAVVNGLRSVPFIILLIVMIPFTVLLIGTSIGVAGAVPPLVISAAPFYARLVENVLREVDRGLFDACQAMGATTRQIIFGALLPESLPGLVAAATVTGVALVSYSAMAGAIGGGGLGDLAIRYGYQRFQVDVMVITVALMVVLVQLLQWAGDRLTLHFTRK